MNYSQRTDFDTRAPHVTRLDTGWRLRCTKKDPTAPPFSSESWSATVPGCVHTDLLAAGEIPNPYLDNNELAVQWVGDCNWQYETTFDVEIGAADHHELVFHGLDTAATVTLNGAVVLRTENMHRTYRVEVGDLLKPTGNMLAVHFLAPSAHHQELLKDLTPRPNAYPGPGNLMRKMACNFGWDWGPTLITMGIWRPVELISWTDARLASARCDVSLDGKDGRVQVWPEIAGDADNLSLVLRLGDRSVEAPVSPDSPVMLDVAAPNLWWPRGLGGQPLYDLEIALYKGDCLLDRQVQRIGFRTIALDTSDDLAGSNFRFLVNGTPVYIRGANWIPDDCFPSRTTRARLADRIEQASDAHINLLRVWGGGIYESDDFYDLCDEAGILVWQDFLFACACYPEEGGLPAEIEAEARENVARIMHHPSLALWNGNNENIWGFQDWGWEEALDGQTWGEDYYLNLLPRVVSETHPNGNYYPGSPYSGTMDRFANADEHGCKHIWDVWNEVGYEVYAGYAPRFVSEFGWQAPPTYATLTAAVSDNPLTPDSPGIAHHQKASDGDLKLTRGLAGHLPQPDGFEDWLFATQLNQAHAVHFGISRFRALQPHCMGAIVWQLNDCWPVTSWAAVDGYGRKKPLWYALRDSYAPKFITVQPQADGLAVHVINEAPLDWRVPVEMTRFNFDGEELARHTVWRAIAMRNAPAQLTMPKQVATPLDPKREVLVVKAGDVTRHFFFAETIDAALPGPEYEAAIQTEGDEQVVEITAHSLLKDFCLFADRLDPGAVADKMLLTLLPGETAQIIIRNCRALTKEDLRAQGVIRTANSLL